MKILTVESKQLDLNDIEDEIEPTQFVVVDLGSELNPYEDETDIIFPKLVYIEEVTSPAIKCQIGKIEFLLPLTWNIFIGEEDVGEVELIPLTSINARDFSVLITNPLKGFRTHFEKINVKEVLIDYDWSLPKLKNGQALALPLDDSNNCLYITSSTTKIPNEVAASDFI